MSFGRCLLQQKKVHLFCFGCCLEILTNSPLSHQGPLQFARDIGQLQSIKWEAEWYFITQAFITFIYEGKNYEKTCYFGTSRAEIPRTSVPNVVSKIATMRRHCANCATIIQNVWWIFLTCKALTVDEPLGEAKLGLRARGFGCEMDQIAAQLAVKWQSSDDTQIQGRFRRYLRLHPIEPCSIKAAIL